MRRSLLLLSLLAAWRRRDVADDRDRSRHRQGERRRLRRPRGPERRLRQGWQRLLHLPGVQQLPTQPGLRGRDLRLQVHGRRGLVGHPGRSAQRREQPRPLSQPVRGSPVHHREPGERPPVSDRDRVFRLG